MTLMTVHASMKKGQLTIPVSVEGRVTEMVVDTWSPVSVISKVMVRNAVLDKCDTPLRSYGGSFLQILGTCNVNVTCRGVTKQVKMYVVPHGMSLMGLDLMKEFGVDVVDTEVCAVSSQQSGPSSVAVQLSSGGGKVCPSIIGYQHKVTVDPTVPPVRQGLRRLPLAVRDEVGARVKELESQGVIERIQASTWVSPIVVVNPRLTGVFP